MAPYAMHNMTPRKPTAGRFAGGYVACVADTSETGGCERGRDREDGVVYAPHGSYEREIQEMIY